jgi:hypothetical protein
LLNFIYQASLRKNYINLILILISFLLFLVFKSKLAKLYISFVSPNFQFKITIILPFVFKKKLTIILIVIVIFIFLFLFVFIFTVFFVRLFPTFDEFLSWTFKCSKCLSAIVKLYFEIFLYHQIRKIIFLIFLWFIIAKPVTIPTNLSRGQMRFMLFLVFYYFFLFLIYLMRV